MGKIMSDRELNSLLLQLQPVAADASEAWSGLADGSIETRGQRILIRDPVPGGCWPTIDAADPVKLCINGREVSEPTVVSSADTVDWAIRQRPLYELSVSPDGLSVCLRLAAVRRHAWRLVDSAPAASLTLRAEEETDIVLETVQPADISGALDAMGVRSRIDCEAIIRECASPTGNPVVVARGMPAVYAKDARLDIFVPLRVESRFFEIGGVVDLRNHLRIPTVGQGDAMARITPASHGQAGCDVFGNALLPGTPRDIKVAAGESAFVADNGDIVALREGRPRITGSRRLRLFDVSPEFAVPGDVDVRTGNVAFAGDIVVYGDVTDNTIVEALGNVYVYGGVYRATIAATGSVYVRGSVIGGKLCAGEYGVAANRLYRNARLLIEELEQWADAAGVSGRESDARRQPAPFWQIHSLPIDNRPQDLPGVLKGLLEAIAGARQLGEERHERLRATAEAFAAELAQREPLCGEGIRGFIALLRETAEAVERMREPDAEIGVNQCHNSELSSSGGITVHAEGVLLSRLKADGSIVFNRAGAVCRGSTLEAGKRIVAGIIGGRTGAGTVLRAADKIAVRRIYSGRVCIGKYCKDVFEVAENAVYDRESFRSGS